MTAAAPSASVPDLLGQRFREAMRGTVSGVTVLTTDGVRGRAGITVSSMSSLSMEPPSVIACVHRDNRALPCLLDNGVFVANVLAEPQHRVADSFAGLIPALREDRFAAASWSAMATGAPALEDALCNFDCELAQVFDFGTHRILIGRVVDVRTSPTPPLAFSQQRYQRIAHANH
ncbi:flavin reductase family protein [Variovorax sp. RB2P76]|jgi:flavin reductase (DIM6/NTAB) family NADH-FMN oxidoreductase RutF|uniref:flavin reductase family protein n=1 Tax=Variovorax sp. RB2P76 TaxID=3443736 RepID=UPI003F46811C